MKTKKNATTAILNDLVALYEGDPGHRPSSIEAAMYIEDGFDIVLTDEEIASLEGAGPDEAKRFVSGKLEP